MEKFQQSNVYLLLLLSRGRIMDVTQVDAIACDLLLQVPCRGRKGALAVFNVLANIYVHLCIHELYAEGIRRRNTPT